MANDFNHGVAVLGATATAVYEAPAGSQVVVIGMWVANINTSNGQKLTLTRLYDASAQTRTMAKDIEIPVGGGFSLMDVVGKLVLLPGDIIYGMGNNANQLEMGIEVLEIT